MTFSLIFVRLDGRASIQRIRRRVSVVIPMAHVPIPKVIRHR